MSQSITWPVGFTKTLCGRTLLVLRFFANAVFSRELAPSHEEPEPKSTGGRSRMRRPKTGNYKPILVALSDEERASMKRAAKEGVSISQFMARRSAQAAKRLLAKPSESAKQ